MARQEIDLTTPQPNGKMGEPTKSAWTKVNDMTAELYPLAENAMQNTGGNINGTVILTPNGTDTVPSGGGVLPIYSEARVPNVDRILLTGYKFSTGGWETFDWTVYRSVDDNTQGSIRFQGSSNGIFGSGIVFGSSGNDRWGITSVGDFVPASDNSYSIGSASRRASVVFSATGSINTSDARDKTSLKVLSEREINASIQIANEIGLYKFLESVEKNGESARSHVGLTVQKAINILESNGLNPFDYAFICHDEWSYGDESFDKYGFRVDQLNLFITAGINARLKRLEDIILDK